MPQDIKTSSFLTSGPAPATPTLPSTAVLPEGWSEHKSPEGKIFYYNCITKESRWTVPSGPPSNPPLPPVETQGSSHSSESVSVSPKHSSPVKALLLGSPLEVSTDSC